MKLEIESTKNRFILKESLVFDVRFRNDGSAPVETPQISDNRNVALTYELRGPSAGNGLRFHYGSAADFRLPGDPEMISVKPGEVQEDAVDMVGFVKEWKPGRHEIVAHWNNTESKPFPFTIVAPLVKSAQILSDGWPVHSDSIRIAFLEGEGNIYQGFYSEPTGTTETPATSRFVHAVSVPADAEQVLTPWTNFDRGSVFFSRFGWIGKQSVGMRESGGESTVEMGITGEKVIGPALMTKSGEVSIFLLKGRQLAMARLPRQGQGNPGVVWEVELPKEAASGNSALGLNATGNVAGAVVVIEDGESVSLAIADGGKLRTHKIDQAKLIAGSQPALWIGSDGGMRAMVIAAVPGVDNRIQLLEVIWAPRETDAKMTRGAEVAISGKLTAAAVVYAPFNGTLRRDWVVALEGGEVLSSRAHGEVRRFGSGPVIPLQLAARASETYLLVHHPVNVLALSLLH